MAKTVITSATYANGTVNVVWQAYNTQNLTGFLITFYDTTGHSNQNTPVSPGTLTTGSFTPKPAVTPGWTYNVVLYPLIAGAPFPGWASDPVLVSGTP